MVWLVPPLAVATVLDRRRWVWPCGLAIAIMLLTQVLFPWAFSRLIALDPFAVVVLTARNVLLMGFLAWMIVRLARVPVRAKTVPSETAAAAG